MIFVPIFQKQHFNLAYENIGFEAYDVSAENLTIIKSTDGPTKRLTIGDFFGYLEKTNYIVFFKITPRPPCSEIMLTLTMRDIPIGKANFTDE